jgi:hypothetical protein
MVEALPELKRLAILDGEIDVIDERGFWCAL